MDLSDEALSALEELARDASQPPWKAFVEGRDHISGSTFIKIGEGEDRGDDMYVFRETVFAAPYDLDLIAAARNALLPLIEEVRRLRRDLADRTEEPRDTEPRRPMGD